MIAIITSTINPSAHSYFSVEERYLQTINTINKLFDAGFNHVFLIDNSIEMIDSKKLIAETQSGLKIHQIPQYTFENKGLNEALLILNSLYYLPDNELIFKISGRYYPNENFNLQKLIEKLKDKEILGVCYDTKSYFPFFSTRAYLIRDKKTLELVLTNVIFEMIAYARDSSGIKGILKKVFFNRNIIGTPFTLSLEQSFLRVIKSRDAYMFVDQINIEGFIAGSSKIDFICE